MVLVETSCSIFLWLDGPNQGLVQPRQGSCLLSRAAWVLSPKAVPCCASSARQLHGSAGHCPTHTGAASARCWLCGRVEVLPCSSSQLPGRPLGTLVCWLSLQGHSRRGCQCEVQGNGAACGTCGAVTRATGATGG